MATVSKDRLHNAASVLDFVPEQAEWDKVSFLRMAVNLLDAEGERRATGKNELLNERQIELLQTTDYASNFYLNARGKRKGEGPDGLKDHPDDEWDFNYYFTVVPEKEAEYIGGRDALIQYLKENSRAAISAVSKDNLRSGRINFTVTKEGTLSNIQLDGTCGYPFVDTALIQLLLTLPGKWHPATDVNGERVEQELVFFFGQVGC